MKGLFCYDGPISCDKRGNYYGTVLNNQVFKRYFTIVDSLDVAIRVEEEVTLNNKASLITLENLKIIKMPNISSLRGILKKQEAVKLLEKNVKTADILFIRLPSFIGNIAVGLAKKYNKKYLIEMVGCPWDSLWNHSIKGKIIAPYLSLTTKRNLKTAEYVVYVTNSFLQSRYSTKGKYVNCSNVELKSVDNTVLENRIKKIKSNKDKIVIGTAAALNVKYKGQQYIIEAIARLKQEGIMCEYQLVGWGDSTYILEQAKKYKVEDCIKVLGALPHKDVFTWLDNIDVYAQPSRQEGLPRALIEAMSRGCPAIGAKTGGIPELLEGQYIFSNTHTNISEICAIIKSFTQDQMIRQATRNFYEAKQYNRETINNRREEFFKLVINE